MKNKMLLTYLGMCLVILACNNNDKKSTPEIDQKENDTIIEIKDSIQEEVFNINQLDSIIENVFGSNLVEKAVYNTDSIQQYTGLLEIFETKGLESIKYKCLENEIVSLELIELPLNGLPGRINQLIFESKESAKKSFSTFAEEIANRNLKEKINIKAGAVCFVNDNIIYLIPIKSCGDHKDIDLITDIIERNVFTSSTEGIKLYCSLQKFEFLKKEIK